MAALIGTAQDGAEIMNNSKELSYNQDLALITKGQESEIVLNTVINSLRGIFPGWRNAIKTQSELDNLKKEWLAAFIDNKINTDTQINKGLSIARQSTSSFIPSLGQFIEWCKVPTINIESVNLENVNKTSPKKVTQMLQKKCPWYKSRNAPSKPKDKTNV